MNGFAFDDLKYLALDMPQEINLYKFAGDFDGEIAVIDRWLSTGKLSVGMRKRLEIERVFAEGLKSDYRADFDAVLEGLQKAYPQAKAENLEEIIRSGNVDFIMKNGKRYFQNEALANMLNQHAGYLKRISDPDFVGDDAPGKLYTDTWKTMREKGKCAYRFEVEFKFTIDEGYDREGKRIRVWLPYPVECETQRDIKLISSSHPVKISDGKIRTAMIETTHKKGAVYSVRYSYINEAKYTKLDPADVLPVQPDMPEYTSELYPHIRFTPFINQLANEIKGNETNPLILARRVYDWICDHVKYSYVRDYLYIDNIPEYVLMNGYGDCGTMALAFITLCRCLGIPAKWQSGNSARPGYLGSHDWAMFYVAPYGWLYCDPSYGNTSCKEKHEHYFGNLDPFRLVACNDFQLELDPPKKFMRMDPYDNQSGEAEYEDENIFFEYRSTERRMISAEEVFD